MIEAGARIEICHEHGPSCQLDYPFRLMGQFDLRRAVLRPHGSGGRVSRWPEENRWTTVGRRWTAVCLTRAQAARAANQ